MKESSLIQVNWANYYLWIIKRYPIFTKKLGVTLEIIPKRIYWKGYHISQSLEWHPARIIGVVKNVNFSIAYFESKFEKFKSQVDLLIERIEQTKNRGSFLNKAKHLKATLPELKGLGDFQALDHKISDLIELILKTIKGNRTKNAEVKSELIQQITAATDLLHWGKATTQILSIQKKWFHTGPAEASKEAPLNEEFKNILDSFFYQKKAFYDDKNNLAAFYERKYEALIQEAKKLESLSEDQKLSKLESLKIAWKENGIIKKSNMTNWRRNLTVWINQ